MSNRDPVAARMTNGDLFEAVAQCPDHCQCRFCREIDGRWALAQAARMN